MYNITNMSFKIFYYSVIGFVLFLLFIILILSFQVEYLRKQIIDAIDTRYTALSVSHNIEDILDDGTEKIRLYIATGNPDYKAYYLAILGMRNGTLGIPQNYSSRYWDLILGGMQSYKPLTSTSSQSLLTEIKQAHFDELEEQLLQIAYKSIQDLTNNFELPALYAMEGLRQDKAGNYTIQGAPNSALAKELLYGKKYFIEKARIIEIIDQFLAHADKSSATKFIRLEQTQYYTMLALRICALLVFVFAVIAFIFVSISLSQLDELLDHANSLSSGDYQSRNAVTKKNEFGTLGMVLNQMAEKVQTEITRYKMTVINLEAMEKDESLINKLNDELKLCVNSEEAYERIELMAKELFPELSGGLSIYNQQSKVLYTVATWGEKDLLKKSFLPEDCFAIRSGNVITVYDPEKAFQCQSFNQDIKSQYIGIPLIVQNEVIGVIHFFPLANQEIAENHKRLVITFGNVVKLALANIKLRVSLQHSAIHDPLTGLYNRLYLSEMLPREIARGEREQQSICIAMMDIDWFKRFNDNYGHQAGDNVLKYIGDTLMNQFRHNDIVCRYGGEEFLIAMTNSNRNEALERLRSLSNKIKNAHIYFSDKLLPSLSVSIGVAFFPENGLKMEELIHSADEALYNAKQNGRDQIKLFGE